MRVPSPRRNVAVLGASIAGMALGEELWLAYVPAYLVALGASGLAVGVFGSLKDLLDGAYQYPGGWLADRYGRRAALITFTALAIAGYAVYALATDWPLVCVGLVGVMAWKAGAFPATFAVIADAFPPGRRGLAFSLQSILVRVPRVVSAPLGGLLVSGLGILVGIRLALVATLAIASTVLVLQWLAFRDPAHAPAGDRPLASLPGPALPPDLRGLLVAECLVRTGEAIAASFIVLFVLEIRGAPAATYGLLYALQQAVAIVSYLPGGRLADMTGRVPVVTATLVFFALFPLAVRLATTDTLLALAFVIGGLKEIGEPARKSLIVDLAPAGRTGRTVGAYYTVRNLCVVPGGLIGGWLWQLRPSLPLEVGFAVSLVGAVVFAVGSAGRLRRT